MIMMTSWRTLKSPHTIIGQLEQSVIELVITLLLFENAVDNFFTKDKLVIEVSSGGGGGGGAEP